MKNYTVKEYQLNGTAVRYVIMKDSKKVFLQLLPLSVHAEADDTYTSCDRSNQFSDVYDWFAGALCHIHLSHHVQPPYPNSYKLGQSYHDMYYKSQECLESEDKTVIRTVMTADEGYEVIHQLTHYNGERGFEVDCSFVNKTCQTVTLEMISSASLDGISPYCTDDSSEAIKVHVFRSGWATEGKHVQYTLPELNLEKSWGGNFSNYKIGTQGSRATSHYFPYAAVEDVPRRVMWGMQLVHNATWQIELSRQGRDLSFSCGLGDCAYGSWYKTLEPGASFAAPKAYIAAVNGDIADLSDVFLKMWNRNIDRYGESGMGIAFNEWCTSWGMPSHDSNLRIAEKLKDSKVKYFVMDAGWSTEYVGNWQYKQDAFPHGLKAYTDALRSMGFVPGIWMEFECTGDDSVLFDAKYDDLHLKHRGSVIVGQVNVSRRESFWDFRNPETRKLLRERVIRFLKDNGFGYLKVDYNANIGIGCDGAESPGEGLRQQMEAVHDFFAEIKKEIPDIVIENCSSGGMRIEPYMMSVAAMCSFSDAHECYEFPIIAANLHYLVPPCQCQIWNVLKPEFSPERFAYTISAGFLGRICWSGNVAALDEAQMGMLYAAEAMYEEVAHVIRYGKSVIYRTEQLVNFRHPKGTQAVLRYADNQNEALLVYHCFDQPEQLVIPLDGDWEIAKTLYPAKISLGRELVIAETKEVFGNVVLLKRA